MRIESALELPAVRTTCVSGWLIIDWKIIDWKKAGKPRPPAYAGDNTFLPPAYAGGSDKALSRLRLHRGDRHGVDDIFRFAAPGKIVGGLVESLENGADRGCAGESFGKLIGDVA